MGRQVCVSSLGRFVPFGLSYTTAYDDDDDDDNNKSRPREGRYSLFLGESGQEEEVFVEGGRVVWSAGGHVVRVCFTLREHVFQVLRCEFSNGGALCLQQRDALHVRMVSGAAYSVVLPCKARRLWSIPGGLLVERAVSPMEMSTPTTPAPVLFSLCHPIEDLKPVATLRNYTSSSDGIPPEFLSDVGLRVVLTTGNPPLVVTYDGTKQGHTVWALRKAMNSPWELQEAASPVEDPEGRMPSYLMSEEGEDLIDAEFFLEPVYDDTTSTPPATSAFLATDATGDTLLCLVVPELEELQGLAFADDLSLLRRFRIEGVKRAVPVSSTRSKTSHDVLVLHTDGSLVLYIGDQRICDCVLPSSITMQPYERGERSVLRTLHSPSKTPGRILQHGGDFTPASSVTMGLEEEEEEEEVFMDVCNASMIEDDKVLLVSPAVDVSMELESPPRPATDGGVSCPYQTPKTPASTALNHVADIRDGVGDRVTIALGNGSLYRVQLCFRPFSPLVERCLEALSCFLPTPQMMNLLSEFLVRHASMETEDAEWQSFMDVLRSSVLWKDMPSVDPVVNDGPLDGAGTDADWEFMLASGIHRELHLRSEFACLNIPPPPSLHIRKAPRWEIRPDAMLAVRALHFVYEDYKLCVLATPQMKLLAQFMIDISSQLGLWDYVDHYARDFGDLAPIDMEQDVDSPLQQDWEDWITPPSIFRWIDKRLRGGSAPSVFTQSPCPLTRKVCFFYDVVAMQAEGGGSSMMSSSHGNSLSNLDSGEEGRRKWKEDVKGMFLLDPSRRKYSRPPTTYDLRYTLACSAPEESNVSLRYEGRTAAERLVLAMVRQGFTLQDLDLLPIGVSLPLREAMRVCRHSPPAEWPVEAFILVGREDLAAGKMGRMDDQVARAGPVGGTSSRGEEHVESDPDGMEQVQRKSALRFGKDLRVKEVKRLLRSLRAVQLSIKRMIGHDVVSEQQVQLLLRAHRTMALPVGRGMFTLASARPLLTEALRIPDIVLAGLLPPTNALVNLDMSSLPSNLRDWPEFHNGAAAGLRIATGQTPITRTWIVYNKPENPTYSHGGLLMALGLQGHLKALAVTDLFRLLSQGHEATTIGVLLGMAASYRGSMDGQVTKMLALHLPAFLPPSLHRLEVALNAQAAALIGVGLLYQGSAHRRMTELLLDEIGRRSDMDRIVERECYCTAAGLALGMLTLGLGRDAAGLTDLHLEDRLLAYIVGGKRCKAPAVHNSRINEGDLVNVSVTAPGAALALGLMYHRRNDSAIATLLEVPDTRFMLQNVRPDLIVFRVLAKHLIMWTNIEPTHDWLLSNIPVILRRGRSRNAMTREHQEGEDNDDEEMGSDTAAVRQAWCYVVAGCCMAVGLKCAGSGSRGALELLNTQIDTVLKLKTSASDSLDSHALQDCLNVIVLSLGLVMAGSGHLPTLQRLRELRILHFKEECTYGSHMALHMAIGFLFLGGGEFSLGTSPASIAALMCALFPKFPSDPTDNREHLQALRHLYVLAAEPRCIETRDVDTDEPCYVPLEFEFSPVDSFVEGSISVARTSPCLVPEFDRLRRIKVSSPRYWPLELDFERNMEQLRRQQGVIYVKRKAGHLDYRQDPMGFRSILARSFPKHSLPLPGDNVLPDGSTPLHTQADFLSSFSASPHILSFAQFFCKSMLSGDADSQDARRVSFYTGMLYECLTHEKLEVVETYLFLHHTLSSVKFQTNSLAMNSVRLVLSYYDSPIPPRLRAPDGPLIQQSFLDMIRFRLFESFEELGVVPTAEGSPHSYAWDAHETLVRYTRRGLFPNPQAEWCHLRTLWGCFLVFVDFPCPHDLHRAREVLRELPSGGSPTDAVPFLSLVLPGLSLPILKMIVMALGGDDPE